MNEYYLLKEDQNTRAVDISDIQPSHGDYICPCCGVFMLPLSLHDYETIGTDAVIEVQCPSCGCKINPITDQTKHASKLVPIITEGMMSEEEGGGSNIFEVVVDEDSSRARDEDENDPFAEDDRRDEESLKRKGYRILSST